MLAQARASIAMTNSDADALAEELAQETSDRRKRGIVEHLRSRSGSRQRESPIPMEFDLTSGVLNGGGAHSSISEDDMVSLADQQLEMTIKATQYAKMILPHIGLVILLAVFTLVGALVFHYLELPNEQKTRAVDKDKIYELQARIVMKLWFNLTQNDTNEMVTVTLDEATRNVDQEFDRLYEAVFDAYRHQFVTAPDVTNKTDKILWTLPNSIFFATTVITTIGYGNLVPSTMYGRGFCIVFALMGIPLLLVTIADIGKFLSDFLSFLYKNYRDFKRKLRRQSRRISRNIRSRSASGSNSPAGTVTPVEDLASPVDEDGLDEDSDSDTSSEGALRIPVIMVMFVLIAYTALGGFLFRYLERWTYFEAFYFCFITMATVGFGDFVPTEQVYMVITMAYIVFGLALATMCIDLAGTEYIRKIHYIGMKMDSAKEVVGGAMVSGLHASEGFLKNTGYGFIKTAGGKLVAVRGRMINSDTFYMDAADLQRNILYEPLSPHVAKIVKPHIGVLPDQINDDDAFIVNNKVFNQAPPRHHYYRSPNAIHRQVVSKRPLSDGMLVVPFVLKESQI